MNPGRAAVSGERFVLAGALRLAHDVGELEEDGGALGGDAAGADDSKESACGALVIGFGGRCAGDRSEFAAEIILAGSAWSESAVSEAESVESGVGGLATAASVGESEAAAVGVPGHLLRARGKTGSR